MSSPRHKYLKVLSELFASGTLGTALILGSSAPAAASEANRTRMPDLLSSEGRSYAVRGAAVKAGGGESPRARPGPPLPLPRAA